MATKSFTVRISLDGGADIKKQLEDIGKAGKKAFSDLEDASRGNSFLSRIGTNVTEAVAKLGTLGRSLRDIGGAATEFGSKIGGSIDRLAALGGLSIGGAVAGFISLTKAAGEASEQLRNTADTLGITGQKLKNLRDSFGLAGIDEGTFDRAMLKLSNGMADAGKASLTYQRNLRDLRQSYNEGEISSDAYWKAVKKLKQANEDSLDPFTRLGITIKNTDGSLRKADDVLEDVADVFHKMPDGAEKAGLSMDLFGAKNSRLIGKLNEGRAAMVAANKEAQRLAPALDKMSGNALADASDSFEQLHKTIASVKNSILATFSPQVTKLVMAFVEAIVRNRTDLTLYASTIADKVKPVVADLVALLEGRDSDVRNQSIIKAKESMLDFAAATKNAIFGIIIPAFNAFLTTLDLTVKAINAVFGTDLTAGQIAIVGVVLRLTGLFGVLTSGARLAYVAVGALVTTFGAIPVAIAAAGFAIGYLLVKLITDWEGTTQKIAEFWNALWAMLPEGAQNALAAVAAPFIEFGRIVGRIISGLVILFASLFNGEFVSNLETIFAALWQALQDGAFAAWEAIKNKAQETWDAIKQGVSDAADWIVQSFSAGFDAVADYIRDWVSTKVMPYLQPILDAINTIGSYLSGGSDNDTPGFASGGLIRGPGTGTSDSIPIRASNGEFIHPLKAVSYYGVGIMRALQKMRIPRELLQSFAGIGPGVTAALTQPMTGFRNGGLVSVPAGSGGSSDLHPANIHLRDGSFPVMAQQNVIDALSRYSAGKQVRTAGRKPTWYRG